MTNALVLLQEFRGELLLIVQPDTKKKEQYTHMKFELSDSSTAIYHTIKKASSLRYDYGHPVVKIEIGGSPSTEMSIVTVTKLTIR